MFRRGTFVYMYWTTANSRGMKEYFDMKGDLVKFGGLNANEKHSWEMLPDKEGLW